MTGTFQHAPVMEQEILSHLCDAPPGVLVDATLGGAGHARALLDAHPGLQLVGIDRDEDALAAAGASLQAYGDRASVHRAGFDEIGAVVRSAGHETISAVLFDLGVSSPQLDRADRGFSYREDGPLDMRMDRRQDLTASDIINRYDERELIALLRELGDERHAHRIAKAIVAHRPFSGTAALAEVIRDAIPAAARRKGGHPAKRSFQAIRIAVNGELQQIAPALEQAIDLLAPGGRGAVLSYHSGEDRIVKKTLRDAAGKNRPHRPVGLPELPGEVPALTLVPVGSRTPSDEEIDRNPRARSARLRTFVATGSQDLS